MLILFLGLLRNWLRKLQDLPEEFSNVLNTRKTLSPQIEEKMEQLYKDLSNMETCDICGDDILYY